MSHITTMTNRLRFPLLNALSGMNEKLAAVDVPQRRGLNLLRELDTALEEQLVRYLRELRNDR